MARFIGKGFLAAGFLVAIYGLTEGHPILLRSGMGLLVAGVLAMGYGLYQALVGRSRQPGE